MQKSKIECTTARWKTRGRGTGVRGPRARGPRVWTTRVWRKTRGLVEITRSGGKHGVWWKTQGLSGKHWVPLFFAKIWTFSTKMEAKILLAKLRWISIQHPSAWNAFLDQESKLNISWESRNHLRAFQSVVHWFSFGDPLWSVYFIFHSNLRVFFTFGKER